VELKIVLEAGGAFIIQTRRMKALAVESRACECNSIGCCLFFSIMKEVNESSNQLISTKFRFPLKIRHGARDCVSNRVLKFCPMMINQFKMKSSSASQKNSCKWLMKICRRDGERDLKTTKSIR